MFKPIVRSGRASPSDLKPLSFTIIHGPRHGKPRRSYEERQMVCFIFFWIVVWKRAWRCEICIAAPEDRALQGCNPSAACGRYTAGSGPSCPGPVPPAPSSCVKSPEHRTTASLPGAQLRVGGAGRLPITIPFFLRCDAFGPRESPAPQPETRSGLQAPIRTRALWSRLHYGLSDSHSSESKRFHLRYELWPARGEVQAALRTRSSAFQGRTRP